MSLGSMLKRRAKLLVLVMVVAALVAVAAGVLTASGGDRFEAEARVFVPSLNPASPASQSLAVDRFQEAAESRATASAVADALDGAVSERDVRNGVRVRTRASSGLVSVIHESDERLAPQQVLTTLVETALSRTFASEFARLNAEVDLATERRDATVEQIESLVEGGLTPPDEASLLLAEITSLQSAQAQARSAGDGATAEALGAELATKREELSALQDDVRDYQDLTVELEQAVREEASAVAELESSRRVLIDEPLSSLAISETSKISPLQSISRAAVSAAGVALVVGLLLIVLLEFVQAERSDEEDGVEGPVLAPAGAATAAPAPAPTAEPAAPAAPATPPAEASRGIGGVRLHTRAPSADGVSGDAPAGDHAAPVVGETPAPAPSEAPAAPTTPTPPAQPATPSTESGAAKPPWFEPVRPAGQPGTPDGPTDGR